MKAQIRTESISLKTYPFSDPAPVPEFGRLYPYNRFDGYTSQGTDTSWEMVVMENAFIKLWINPAVGGKVWGAIEKSTGKEFIYFNHVVKFRDVAMRGPWTSGGLETNIGIIGHSPSCSAPVDHAIRENSDGSVSCFIGATDWSSRSRWTVEFYLHPEAAFFETRTSWFNNSLHEQAYYNWSNAGIKTAGELQYIFPGHAHLGHDGVSHEWPLDDKNRDLSFYNNNDFGHYKSYHVTGAYSNFWGCYWHANQFGMAHYANYDEKPGKKIWIWGLSRYGMLWEDLLTDTDGQYTEVQSGRMFNQSISASSKTPFKHRSFQPYTTDQWNECWFPVTGLHGLTYTCPELSFFYNGNASTLQFTANKPLRGRLKLQDGKHILQEPVALQPLETVTIVLPEKFDQQHLKLFFNGELLFDYSEQATVLSRPLEITPNVDPESVQGLYIQGKEWERQRFFAWAIEKYESCLAKDPGYLPALTALAARRLRSMLYQEAMGYLLQALAIDTYDGEANYLYGLTCRERLMYTDSKDGFSVAALSPSHRGAAYTELGRMLVGEQQYQKAVSYLEKALVVNTFNKQALQLLAVTCRKQHNPVRATKILEQLLVTDPLDHLAHFEMGLISGATRPTRFDAYITGELPHETYIELASFYNGINCYEEAVAILAAGPRHALLVTWQAWMYAKGGFAERADSCLQDALELAPDFVFPHRAEDAGALSWARTRKSSWKLDYYLALVYIQLLRLEEARELLNGCGSEPEFYPLYLLRAQQQPQTGEADLSRAVQCAPREWRPALQLSRFHEERENWAAATAAIEALFQQHPDNYYLGLQLAKCFLKTSRFKSGINILQQLVVLPNEGASEGRNIWRETNLSAAIESIGNADWQQALAFIDAARSWPENLGVGKPYDVDERLEDFVAYHSYENLDKRQTPAYADRIMSFRDDQPPFAYGSSDFFTLYLLASNGQPVSKLLEDWSRHCKDPLPLRWAKAFMQGDRELLQQLDNERQQSPTALPYEIPYTDREFFFVKMLYKLNILQPQKRTDSISK